jgi:hypothetical protein
LLPPPLAPFALWINLCMCAFCHMFYYCQYNKLWFIWPKKLVKDNPKMTFANFINHSHWTNQFRQFD